MLQTYTDLEHVKIKNGNVRKALESDVANYIVEEMQKVAKEDLNNLFGEL